MSNITITGHARFKIRQRTLDENLVKQVVENPERALSTEEGRRVYQARFFDSVEGKEMLLRVVTEDKLGSVHVITVYKTSKIDKYGR